MIDSQALLLRVADFHLAALALLVAITVLTWLLRQPAHRLALAWGSVAALALLLALALLPGLARFHLTSTPSPSDASAQSIAAAEPLAFAAAATPTQQTPPRRHAAAAASLAEPVASQPPVAAAAPTDWRWVGSLAAIAMLLAGSALAVGWLLVGWIAGRRLVDSATTADQRLQALLVGCTGDRRSPRLLVSDRLPAAVAIGLSRPTIVLPARLAAQSSDADVRAMLAHECAHLRHGDLWLLAALRLLAVALWPNPLYWLLRRRIRLDQEVLADAAAADLTDRIAYAARLVEWARCLPDRSPRLRPAGATGIWEGRSQLCRRVALLLDERFAVVRQASLRRRAAYVLACAAVAIGGSLVTLSPAADPPVDPIGSLGLLGGVQTVAKLPVRVIDADGKPVAGAKVTPWALRSSQGHGWWLKDDKSAGFGPQPVITDDQGAAVVDYPLYRDLRERVRTLSVSLNVDHPEFAYINDLHIDVPLEGDAPHEIPLTRGVTLEVQPTIDGQPAELDGLFAAWSDGRSWLPGAAPEKTAAGTLRFPAMAPGANSLLLVKLQGDHATHFSPLTDIELVAGQPQTITLPLQPAARIEGALSDNVPRPVRNGRIKLGTLPPAGADFDRTGWFSWVPVRPDGTFTIPAWPADEPLQLIALCDGYIAASGEPPAAVQNPPDAAKDPFSRPQVFDPAGGGPIEVAMTPLVRCVVTTVDETGEPIAGVTVASWPNVGWWNDGSQIYCESLVRGERLLRTRDYRQAQDKQFGDPFQGDSDAQGKVTLELPAGKEGLTVISEQYELPVFLGTRDTSVQLTPGQTSTVTLRLQPRGTDRLGEWDKLAGVVFGCSTREGRRICALPGVREKMDEFAERFRDAKNQRDPRLLAEAYATVADAFQGVGDQAEADKWRQKAAEQAALIDDPPAQN